MRKTYIDPGLSKSEVVEFESFVKSNMKRAYFTALGLTGSHDAAMEVSQEAFLKAYRHFGRFDRSKNFFTWYYKILRNLCLNLIRDKKRKKEVAISAKNTKDLLTAGIFEDIENLELQKQLEDALEALDAGDRELIILREFDGMSYKEIAELLDIPEGTVMSRLYYTRKKLSAILKRSMV